MADTPVVTPDQLRVTFPAFKSTVAYPDPVVAEWLGIAQMMLRPARWGTMLPLGIKLFAAHNLALNNQEEKAAARGATPGVSRGPINNESVSKVSVGFDTQAAIELDGGFWNLTTYGTRFLHWARMMGTGGMQVPDNNGALLSGVPSSGLVVF